MNRDEFIDKLDTLLELYHDIQMLKMYWGSSVNQVNDAIEEDINRKELEYSYQYDKLVNRVFKV